MNGEGSNDRKFGQQLARLHLHNAELLAAKKGKEKFIGADQEVEAVQKFGFDVTTCCGFLPQKNDFSDDWVEFFTRNRLQVQVDMLAEKSGDRELLELWAQLQLHIPNYFTDVNRSIVPGLLHGDLWSGNYSSVDDFMVK